MTCSKKFDDLVQNDSVFRGTVHIKCAIMGNVLKMHVLIKWLILIAFIVFLGTIN